MQKEMVALAIGLVPLAWLALGTEPSPTTMPTASQSAAVVRPVPDKPKVANSAPCADIALSSIEGQICRWELSHPAAPLRLKPVIEAKGARPSQR